MISRYLIIPIDPLSPSVSQHLDDLEAVAGITFEDLITNLLIGYPSVGEPAPVELRGMAEVTVINALNDDNSDLNVDLEALFCLVHETLEILDSQVNRTLRIKPPNERWLPVSYRNSGLLVKREKVSK
tara:strand:- start:614 stop:997 length:384 start_codon:yes stop_codon:yes gene_type:complete